MQSNEPSMAVKQEAPLVTIVIPTYNRMPLIIEAVQSVISQTYTNWELFVVDDGSTDDTILSIKAIGDKRIYLIELPHKGLVGPLRNAGALKGKGEWISFLDSDDVWLPQKLELQIKALKQSGLECCYTNFELMDENGKTIPPKAGKFEPFTGNIIKQLLRTETTITIVSVILTRKLFNRVNGFSNDPRLLFRQDYEFELRLALNVEMIALIDVLVKVREHPGRTTNSINLASVYLRAAIPYEIFIEARPGKELEKIAIKERNKHLRAATKLNFLDARYLAAFGLFKKILLSNLCIIDKTILVPGKNILRT